MWNNLILISMLSVLFFSCSKKEGSPESVGGSLTSSLTTERTVVEPSIKVILGSSMSCVLKEGNIKCMGSLSEGDEENVPVKTEESKIEDINLGEGVKVTQLSIGQHHSCALLNDEKVKCWGGNKAGQLGLGDKKSRGSDASEKIDLGTDLTVKQIATGHAGFHTCAILSNDKVKCWGSNSHGQLGLGETDNQGDAPNEMGDNLLYVKLGEDDSGEDYKAKKIVVGDHHTCVILYDDNKVKCWGLNEHGQLGLGDKNNRGDTQSEMGKNLPALDFGNNLYAIDLSLGFDKSCALLNDNSVKCWGSSDMGYLGQDFELGILNDESFVNLGNEAEIKQIAVGETHICTVLDNYQIKCWGSNDNGELGQGNKTPTKHLKEEMGNKLPKVKLGSEEYAHQVSLGYKHSCAVLEGDLIKCWGISKHGMLGLEKSGDIREVDMGEWPSDAETDSESGEAVEPSA